MFIFMIFRKKQLRKGRNDPLTSSDQQMGVFSLTGHGLTIIIPSHMENSTLTSLDPEQLRGAMRGWSAGVTVVTAQFEGQTHGMTVNSFTSVSLDPAMITISLQGSSRTHEMVLKSHAFGLTILSSKQAHISDLFAGRNPEVQDRFAGLQTETLITGSPLIVGGLSWLDCRVIQAIEVGMNTLFISEVVAAREGTDGDPLIYHNRKYWNLTDLK
jgi:flavin reductase (DIM6/NTAB) family NADH-FMN oxidoreductase RutF